MTTIINIAELPAPDAIETLSHQAILDQRMADFQALAAEAGFAYDVGELDTDTVKLVERVDAFREKLVRARINDGIRAVLPAYAKGSDLDQVVLRAGVTRLPGETDPSLLQRYLLSFSRPSAGSEDSYIYHALTAWPEAHDVDPRHVGGGKVRIDLLPKLGDIVPDTAISAIRARLRGRYAVPLTDRDMIDVGPATIRPWSVALTLVIPGGPSPALVKAEAERTLAAIGTERYRIGAGVPLSLVYAAAHVPNVKRVVFDQPFVEVLETQGVAPRFDQVTLRVEVAG